MTLAETEASSQLNPNRSEDARATELCRAASGPPDERMALLAPAPRVVEATRRAHGVGDFDYGEQKALSLEFALPHLILRKWWTTYPPRPEPRYDGWLSPS